MKRCTKCNQIKELSLFTKGRNECRACKNARHKKWHKDNPKRSRDLVIKRDYGVTGEVYDVCMATSESCEICGSTKKLVYDHNHDTMEFRGVLCNSCNVALGAFKDSKHSLEKAILYLTERGSYGQ